MGLTGAGPRGSVNNVSVFYSADVSAPVESFSPSAGKPRLAVEAWQAEGLPIELMAIEPVTAAALRAVHDPSYVDAVLACQTNNGFGTRSEAVSRSLLFTSGAMLGAARHALASGIACAPVSGFHHARHGGGGGFCTFNGLMVAAAQLLADGAVHRVMILDADMHYGDGTDDIVKVMGLGDQVENVTLGRWYNTSRDAEAYLARLEQTVGRFGEVDLVLYQAGADVHVDDPLGGVLSTGQMLTRDRLVFEGARLAGCPVAWNLAGGYQTPVSKVLALHTQTMGECVRVWV